MITKTLDTVVKENGFQLPDLIKIDVQGSELDIIKGAPICMSNATDVILELQEIEYNIGVPRANDVISYMESIGFTCIYKKFSKNKFDADYHFRRVKSES